MKKIIILLALFASLLFANIGKISAFSGNVNIERQNSVLTATVGFALLEKDLVKTSDNARAQIVFEDGTVISIGKNAVLNIAEFINDSSNPSNSKTDLRVVEGAFKAITGSIGKIAPERFKLQTKSASIGIRGTIIFGDQAMIACTEGEIEVEVDGIKHILPAGMMIRIRPDGTPTDPEPIEDDQLGGIEGDVEGGSGSTNDDGTNPTNNTEGEESQDGINSDDEMEIEPLPTGDGGQNPLSDTPNSSPDNTIQNTNEIADNIHNDSANDSINNTIDNQSNNSILYEPFSFHGIGKKIEFNSGSFGYWNINGDTEVSPISLDSNGNIVAKLTIEGSSINNVTTLRFQDGDDVYWGYWNDHILTNAMDVPWIVGITTSDTLIGNTSTTISFSGSVMGNVYNESNSTYSNIIQNSNNNFAATIDFGGSAGNMTGNISFDDGFGNNWQGSINSSTSGSSFSGTIFVGGGSISGEGNISGNIYGENEIKAIGGGFYMFGDDIDDNTFKANGIFKAGVQ